MASLTCSKCGRTLQEKEFYLDRAGKRCDMCKKCLTMHINVFQEDTFLWILEKMDMPWIPGQWYKLRDQAYNKDPAHINPTSVFGKYLASMKLNQYKIFDWAHSEEAQEKYGYKYEPRQVDPDFAAEMREKFEAGEISEAQYRTEVEVPEQHEADVAEMERKAELAAAEAVRSEFPRNYFDEGNYIKEEDLPNPADSLSEDDKIYLAVKWGRLYKPNEWVELEKKYVEMANSFDIKDSDTEGTLIVICKTFLKMNQALDSGDMDSFQKLSRCYDTLRKSAKFTAAQNKPQDSTFLSSVGELVDYCEREGGAIPKFTIDEPLDKIDAIINDLKVYNKDLIYSDPSLSTQIEDYLKQRMLLDQRKKEKKTGEIQEELTDQDCEQYFEHQREELAADQEVYNEQ